MGGMCSSPPEPPPNPTHIDLSHFTLLKVVGKGGFGKVNAIQRRSNQELMALKRMSKAEVIKKESHVRMIWTERDIMSRLHSPFLVNLVHAFQDDKEMYFVMPFMQGGDLRFHLGKLGCLSEEDGRFYSAEIILGLESMHSLNIIYRDLKPDNLLLHEDGHLRVSDFGLSVELKEKNGFKIRGNAGTSGYLAPEVCTGEPYGLSSDLWTLGITIYELIHGRRPFKQWKPTDTVDPASTMRFGSGVSDACQDLIRGLLTINPAKRLGCGKAGWAEVKSHPWFATLDWDAIKSRSGRAPIQPDREAANCSNAADLADQLMDKEPESIPAESQKLFVGFDWNTDYREFLAKQQRDSNLAGLNLSTATDLGSGANSNASHMIDEQPAAGTAGADGVDGSHRHVHVAGSATLMPPGSAGAATVAANKAQKEGKTSPDGNGNATTPLSASSRSAVAPAPTSEPSPSSAVATAAAAASSSSAAKYEVPVAAAAASSSSSSAPVPTPAAAASSSSSAAPAPAPAPSPLKQPLSSRRASARDLNEIPFTRHKVDASLSPRGEAAAAAAVASAQQ